MKIIQRRFNDIGFSEKLASQIVEYIMTTNFSMLVNGIPGAAFRLRRGIRQGDLTLPYVFIFVLSILIDIFIMVLEVQRMAQ